MARAGQTRVVVPPGADAERPPDGLETPDAGEYLELDDPGDIAALQDARFESWVWYVWRQPPAGQAREKSDPSRGPRYVAKLYGSLDIEDIRARCGGGTYKIAGYVNGRKLRGFMLEIDGPPRVAPVEPAPGHAPAPTVAAPATPATSEIAALTAQLTQAVAAMTQMAQREPPPARRGDGISLKDLLELLPALQRDPAPAPALGSETLKELIGVLETGIKLGQSGNAPEVNPWLEIVDKLSPTLQAIATNIGRRGAPPPRRGAPPGPGPVSAGAPAGTPPPTASPESSSASVVVESLARAIAEGTEPSDFAGVLEHVLSESQLDQLTAATTDMVIGELAQVSGRFPILATPDARAFVDAVLTELRTGEEVAERDPKTPA